MRRVAVTDPSLRKPLCPSAAVSRAPLLAPFCLAVLLLATLLAPSPAEAQEARPRVAVLEFQNNSTWGYWGRNLGQAATDELATQLVRSGAFTVVERQQIDAILREQHFGLSGAVNANTAAEIGKILGVQAVLLGSITQFSIDRRTAGVGALRVTYTEAETKMDVRLVNTTTAEIMAVAEGQGKTRLGGVRWERYNFQRDFDAGLAQEALRPAVEDAVKEIAAQAPALAALAPPSPAATPGSVVGSPEPGVVYIDRGADAGVQVGQRFDVHRVVDEIRDAAGNVLDRVTAKVGVIEVTRVLSQSSICSVVEGNAQEGDRVERR
jgi:curli biogenesis system outer membrane secretion channel CsgG